MAYQDHGWRHDPDIGTDPTVGATTKHASIRTSSAQTITADNALHYVSLEDGVTGSFGTNAEDCLANTQATGLLTGDPWGLEVKRMGTYRVTTASQVNGGTAAAHATSLISGIGGSLSVLQSGRTEAFLLDGWNASGGVTDFFGVSYFVVRDPADFPADYPAILVPAVIIASGTNPTVNWQLAIERISPYPDTALF